MSETSAVMWALVGYFVFSAAVDAMPLPLPEQDRTFYAWLFRFLHAVSGNLSKLAAVRYPALALPAPEPLKVEEKSLKVTTVTPG